MRTKDKVIADLVKLGVSQSDAAEIWDKAAHSPYNQIEQAVNEELKKMTFTNKIEAIKALRALAESVTFSVVKGEGNTFIVKRDYLGLKDCKDFIEAVMAFGVRDSKRDKYCSQCNNTVDDKQQYCPSCGAYNSNCTR